MLSPLYGTMMPLGRSYANTFVPFVPTSLSGLQVWFKADTGTYQVAAGAAAVSNGDPVGQWQDQSGNANHAAQTTSGLKPVLATSALNGTSVVRFTSAAQALLTFTGVALTDACTIYVVGIARCTGTGTSGFAPFNHTLSDTAGPCLLSLTDLRVGDINNNFYDMSPASYASPQSLQIRVHRAAVGSNFYTKATNYAETAHGHINTITADNIGWSRQNGKYTDGDVAEILAWNRELTSTEMTSVETYLAGRYAVSF